MPRRVEVPGAAMMERSLAPMLPVVRPPDPLPEWITARLPDGTVCPHPGALIPGGIEEGYAEGLRRAERALEAERQCLRQAIEAVGALRDRLLRDSEAQIVDLALAVAGEVILASAERDRELATRLVVSALGALGKAGRTVLRVSPADRASVERWLAALPPDPSRPELAMVEDPTLGSGDVVCEAETGGVDARVQARLAQVARAMREGERTS